MSALGQRRVDHFTGGQWVASRRGEHLPVINPATEQSIATVAEGMEQDVDSAVTAVAAARAAFPTWAATPPRERAGHLRRLASRLQARADESARTITAEMGAPLAFSLRVQAALPVTVMSSYAEVAASFRGEEKIDDSLVILDPLGVVAAITPRNFPLHQVVLTVAAALAAGCTVIVKPSELAPLSTDLLVELAHEHVDSAGDLHPGIPLDTQNQERTALMRCGVRPSCASPPKSSRVWSGPGARASWDGLTASGDGQWMNYGCSAPLVSLCPRSMSSLDPPTDG